jgi:hypothetical protein
MSRNHSVEALNLAKLLGTVDGLVPVHHIGGLPKFVTENGRTTTDWSEPLHQLHIPLDKLEVRMSTQGEPCTHLTYANHEKPTWHNVVRVDGGVIEALLSIPEPVEAALEITLTNGQLVTLRTGETKVKVTVNDAAKFIHNPQEKPLTIRSLNSNIIYDISNIGMSHEVKDIGRLATGHTKIYNWIK